MAVKIYKGDIQNALMREAGISETEASDVVRLLFEHVASVLETDRYVKIKGLGIFKLIDVEARRSINVTTGESIEIPEHKKISFVPDSALKELINKPFAHFETVEIKDGVDIAEDDLAEEVALNDDEAKEQSSSLEEEAPQTDSRDDDMLQISPVEQDTDDNMGLDAGPYADGDESGEMKGGPQTDVQECPQIQSQAMSEQKQTTLISRREELRELDRQMAIEEGRNRWVMAGIVALMGLLVLSGLLFLFAPEFLERLFF